MTSNIAAEYIQKESENLTDTNREIVYDNMKKGVLETLRRTLRPEFLNRIDETIVFSALTNDEIKGIVRLQIDRFAELLAERDMSLKATDAAIEHIAESGYDQTFGARPIKRFINKHLNQQVARMILAGTLKPGDVVKVDYIGNKWEISAVNKAKGEAARTGQPG
jgi:ATP-dependent Clp protease ATP-binding subunit ClpB